MSLTWDLSAIADHEDLCWIKTDETDENGKPLVRMNPVTEALIFSTMGVCIGRITEDNAGEFYARLFIYECVNGAMLRNSEGERPITVEDVQAHIGLRCNVSYEDRDTWARRHFGGDDGLTSYGEKLLDEDERERKSDIRAGLLRTCAELLYTHGNANVAGIGYELSEEADRAERFHRSVTDERASHFRREQRKAVST